jgi:hypothetical protein
MHRRKWTKLSSLNVHNLLYKETDKTTQGISIISPMICGIIPVIRILMSCIYMCINTL